MDKENQEYLEEKQDIKQENNIIETNVNEQSSKDTFDDVQIKIASIDYNKLGIENLSSQSEGSVSNSYIADYPKDITNILNKYRVCRVI